MPEQSSTFIQDQIKELILRLSSGAKTTLVLGNTDALDASNHVIFLAQDQLDRLPEHEQFDFILIQNLIENLPFKTGEHVIAEIRDLHAREMLLILPVGTNWEDNRSHWQPADLTGLGMQQVAEFDHENKSLHAYYYALTSYKKLPDWLNSKYWANPELFDKYRW